jgi:hypothetical protein
MFGGDYRWRLGYRAKIADYKQRDKLFAGKQFRIEVHHPNMASFDNRSVVNFAQIGEEGRLSWRPLYAPLTTAFLARRRIDFSIRLHWLRDRWKSSTIACRTFNLGLLRE